MERSKQITNQYLVSLALTMQIQWILETNMNVELNDQQVDYLKEMLEPIAENNYFRIVGEQVYSRSYQEIARQIINKLEE